MQYKTLKTAYVTRAKNTSYSYFLFAPKRDPSLLFFFSFILAAATVATAAVATADVAWLLRVSTGVEEGTDEEGAAGKTS